MNKTVFANSCEKQKNFLCSLDFTFYEAVLSACSRKVNSTVKAYLLK